MDTHSLINSAGPKMDKALEHLQEELTSLRTGRATTALVDSLLVEQYGQTMALKTIASIHTPDARTISITPWDRTALPNIEKAIHESQSLGLTPNNDGTNIRLNIPPLTEERRRDIAKSLGEKVEACRITLRQIRHEILDDVKKREKVKEATQDDLKYAESELNKKIEQYQAKIEEIARAKEKEIMEV